MKRLHALLYFNADIMGKMNIVVLVCILFSCGTDRWYSENNSMSSSFKDDFDYLEKDTSEAFLNWVELNNNSYATCIDSSVQVEKIFNQIYGSNSKIQANIRSVEIVNNGRHFYLKKDAKDSLHKLYMKTSPSSHEILVYDPNLSGELPVVYQKPSWDGTKIVLGFSEGDSEVAYLKVYDIDKGLFLDGSYGNAMPNSLGGVEWLPNSNGFIYTYVLKTNPNDSLYRLNSEVHLCFLEGSKSVLFSKGLLPQFEINEKDFPIAYLEDPNSKYILCAIANTNTYRDTYIIDLKEAKSGSLNWRKLWSKDAEITNFSLIKDSIIYSSTREHPNGGVYMSSVKSEIGEEDPRTLFFPNNESIVQDVTVIDSETFYVVLLKNGIEASLVKCSEGSKETIQLPFAPGRIEVKNEKLYSNEIWLECQGWTNPRQRLKLDVQNNQFSVAELLKNNQVTSKVKLESKEIEITSRDGMKIPLSLIYPHGTVLDGKNPLIITAYGAYGVSYSPVHYTFLNPWYEQGGVFAVAHVRGGGEKGYEWYKSGYKHTKRNSWNDLIDCTEYLIKEGYTNSSKLVSFGMSAGGLAVGRALVERPELFAGSIIRVGILNPLRMVELPSGRAGLEEFGNPDLPEERKSLIMMDPYLNIDDDRTYPPALLIAGYNDIRVRPWQSVKFAARLMNNSANDVWIKVDFGSGHGINSPNEQFAWDLSNVVAFALWKTGHPNFQLKEE